MPPNHPWHSSVVNDPAKYYRRRQSPRSGSCNKSLEKLAQHNYWVGKASSTSGNQLIIFFFFFLFSFFEKLVVLVIILLSVTFSNYIYIYIFFFFFLRKHFLQLVVIILSVTFLKVCFKIKPVNIPKMKKV